MNTQTRLDKIENKLAPAKDLPYIAVFEQAGVRWLSTNKHDYRTTISGPSPANAPPGVQYINDAEFAALKKSHQVLLIRHIEIDYHLSTLKEAYDEKNRS
jgi:hypothetical protein